MPATPLGDSGERGPEVKESAGATTAEAVPGGVGLSGGERERRKPTTVGERKSGPVWGQDRRTEAQAERAGGKVRNICGWWCFEGMIRWAWVGWVKSAGMRRCTSEMRRRKV